MSGYYAVVISGCGVYELLKRWDPEFEIILLMALMYVRLISVSVPSCVGIGLAIGQSPV
jgi:hypothetical protein